MPHTKIALVTGASSGMGKDFAKALLKEGMIVYTVARRIENMNDLKGLGAIPLKMDITKEEDVKTVIDTIQKDHGRIDVLINNAGFGGHGLFHERDLAADQAMMQVNMVTLTNLTHLYLRGMVKRKQGKILNVSSTASFIPGPLQAVYFATKAYVTSFTQAIAWETAKLNITATALCPGAVATDFIKAGDLEGLDAWKTAKSAKSVAECGYKAMERGDLIAINEPQLRFMLGWIIPFLPRKTILNMVSKFHTKTA